MDSKKLGIIFVVCAAVMWSIEPIFAKFSFSNADVMQTLGIRTLTVTLVAAIYVFATKGSFKVSSKKIPVLVYLALGATVFGEFVYLYALTKIPIINVVIIGHTQPLYILLMTYLFLKEEKLTRHDYIGIGAMILASLFVTAKSFFNLSELRLLTFWDFMVVIASVIWASTAILMKKYLKSMNAGSIVFYRYGIASLFIIPYLIYTSDFFLSNIYQILLGLTIGIGILFYYEALKRIKAAQVSAFELITPFFAASLGFVFFKESVSSMQVVGIIMLILGVRFLAKKEK